MISRAKAIAAILAEVSAELSAMESLAGDARDEATSGETKSEGKYDTRATEASYLARGQAWRIVDGKLYLNYSKSVQTQWVQDVPGNITRGDRNWPGIKQNLAAK